MNIWRVPKWTRGFKTLFESWPTCHTTTAGKECVFSNSVVCIGMMNQNTRNSNRRALEWNFHMHSTMSVLCGLWLLHPDRSMAVMVVRSEMRGHGCHGIGKVILLQISNRWPLPGFKPDLESRVRTMKSFGSNLSTRSMRWLEVLQIVNS